MSRLWRWFGQCAYYAVWPALFIYLFRSTRCRIVVSHGDAVLFVQAWLGNGRWSLPGGGLHRGEDAIAGAIRELAEETDLRLRPEQLKKIGTYHTTRGHRFTYDLFFVSLQSSPHAKAHRPEILEAAWLDPHQIITSGRVDHATRQALGILRAQQILVN